MTNIQIDENINIEKTNFKNLQEFYNYLIENQLITEIGELDEKSLNEESKSLLEKSKNSSNQINI